MKRNRYGIPLEAIQAARLQAAQDRAREQAHATPQTSQEPEKMGPDVRQCTASDLNKASDAQKCTPEAARTSPTPRALQGRRSLPTEGENIPPEASARDASSHAASNEQTPNSAANSEQTSEQPKEANPQTGNPGLRKWRQLLCVTQRQAADLLGFSLPGYQALERGRHWQTGQVARLDARTRAALLWHLAQHERAISSREAARLASLLGSLEPLPK